jgi:hypothetical protein
MLGLAHDKPRPLADFRLGFAKIVTIAAGQVAGGAGGLDENLEPPRYGGHGRHSLIILAIFFAPLRERPGKMENLSGGLDKTCDIL